MKNSKTEFIPLFRKALLLPRYWLTWLELCIIGVFAAIPPFLRDPVLEKMGILAGRLGKRARQRARINLSLCFPEYSHKEREKIIDAMFATALQTIVLMAELALFGANKISHRIRWNGLNFIKDIAHNNKNVIFLVPHAWGVDIPAMLIAASGRKVAAMFHNQKNPVVDYAWNIARRRFGGRLHARNDGIRAFVQSVRSGYWGYYLPDQDFGPKVSEFADFFATYKATLPVTERLRRICRARIIPLFPVYDGKIHQLTINVRPPLAVMNDCCDAQIARQINEVIEKFVHPHPEQYTWLLKFLKTRKAGEEDPY
ncbi:TPA: lauroyl-Kdo(2)-lipid IV(A) myristoyltransferase [Escherichia coli]|nr:lauroyl-Kdo(2)-lipid IV(A) myristoyltransferase [Escherichia coli]HEI2488320.1 lauroyl-Kdo(2)-lipid IV(A) myristoyltransferase [Escherichia coli]HEI2492586.1 lauroyl-Kdo(2)-lipid IV(A) myristoyltransferase [Escherichia coli]HEI2555912.1 lauroyl-Kdo(2)-lipid IV(A) myristoyltransferase [Escherichia coli]HEI2570713.1 lauroyl-Kdo(2)-lipid IV(A) myristoyltransferase [Escherichia coli]